MSCELLGFTHYGATIELPDRAPELKACLKFASILSRELGHSDIAVL
jgi:hypothetical protein